MSTASTPPSLSDLPSPPTDREGQERWLKGREDDLAGAVRSALRHIVLGAYKAFLASLTASGDLTPLDAIPGEWGEFVTNDVGDVLGATYLQGGMSAFIGADARKAVPAAIQAGWVGVINEQALDYERAATNRLVGVGDAVWGDIRSAVVTNLQDGKTVDELRAEIERLTAMSEARAEAIARTETVGAYNNGNHDGATALGDFGPVEHVWRATHDARTRPSHAEADGQVRAFDKPFSVGGVEMAHPHAPGAPAGEVVQCRCVEDLLYPGDVRPDGTRIDMPDPVLTPPLETPWKANPQAAARWDVTEAHLKATFPQVRQVRARIFHEAAVQQRASLQWLDSFDGVKVRRPPKVRVKGAGEYDWLEQIHPKERARLAKWYSDEPSSAIDVVMARAQARGVIADGASVQDFMDEWLYHTRVVDAASFVRRGRLPDLRRLGQLDVESAVTPTLAADGLRLDRLIAINNDDAAGYLASREAAEHAEQAFSALGESTSAALPPWRMSFQTWEAEVRDLEWLRDNSPGEWTAALRSRHNELVPSLLDSGQEYEVLYAEIVEVAKLAQVDVAEWAVIPW